jgi:hypothetical protein
MRKQNRVIDAEFEVVRDPRPRTPRQRFPVLEAIAQLIAIGILYAGGYALNHWVFGPLFAALLLPK